MRGTKKLPLRTLEKLHAGVLKRFNDSYPKYNESLRKGKLKKTDYNKLVSEEVYPNYKDTSWFTRFETGISRASDYLAKYWVFNDLNQPILEHLYEYVYNSDLDRDRISRIINLFKDEIGDFVSNDFFTDLELNRKNIEVNCISADLSWLVNYIDSIIESSERNNSLFKYIVVNPIAQQNIPIINQRLREFNNKRIIIKEAYKNLHLTNKQDIETQGILFPLNDDIVIYKNIPLEIQESQNIGSSILASGTDIFDRSFERRKQDFIVPDKTKLAYTQIWFDAVWKTLNNE